jgi:hypothetical protein
VATDRQIRAAGVSLRRQQHLIAMGIWGRAAPGVVVARDAPVTWHQRASTAVIGAEPSAALSHGSASRLYRLDGYADYPELHVTVAHGGHRNRTGAIQHTMLGLAAADIHRHEGIAVVRMPLAIMGVLVVDGAEAATRALDSALRLGRSPVWFVQTAERWRRSGRTGPAELLELVAERTSSRLPRSWFQVLAHRALTGAGITLVHEHQVFGARRRLLAELDLADVEHRIGVECQSWEWHATPAAQQADATRKRALRRLGWEIIDVWWSDLRRIDDVLATIIAIRAERTGLQPRAG